MHSEQAGFRGSRGAGQPRGGAGEGVARPPPVRPAAYADWRHAPTAVPPPPARARARLSAQRVLQPPLRGGPRRFCVPLPARFAPPRRRLGRGKGPRRFCAPSPRPAGRLKEYPERCHARLGRPAPSRSRARPDSAGRAPAGAQPWRACNWASAGGRAAVAGVQLGLRRPPPRPGRRVDCPAGARTSIVRDTVLHNACSDAYARQYSRRQRGVMQHGSARDPFISMATHIRRLTRAPAWAAIGMWGG